MTDQERSWPERWTIWVCTCGAYSTNRQGGCSHHQGQLPDEPAEFKRKVVAIPADSLKPIIEQLRGMIGVTEHDGTIRPKHLHDLADSLEALTQTGESDAT